MREVQEEFEDSYNVKSAIVIYQNEKDHQDIYISSYESINNTHLINEHPLSLFEIQQLAEILNVSKDVNAACFTPASIIPANVLYYDNSESGYVIWHTPPGKQHLRFAEELHIPSGKAHVPPLIWYATKYELIIYACKTEGRPQKNTPLFNPPFFNIMAEKKVCMGTVEINAADAPDLETFIETWQHYFFDSYFTHLALGATPASENIALLWQSLVHTNKKFPLDSLVDSNRTLNDLLP